MTAGLAGVTINFHLFNDNGLAASPEGDKHFVRQSCRGVRKPNYFVRRRHAHADVEVPIWDSGTIQGDSRG